MAEAIDGAGRVVTLTETSLDAGGGRDALFRTVAGIAALTAGLLAWGRLEMSRRQSRLDRQAAERAVDAQRLAVRAQDATERSQITDRFTKAVEQLGNADFAVRLGGLYALEALAHDSQGRHDAIGPPVVSRVICAYARRHATARASAVALTQSDNDSLAVPDTVDESSLDGRAAVEIALRLPAEWELPIRDLRGVVVTDLDCGGSTIGAVDFSDATFLGDSSFGSVVFTWRTLFDRAVFEKLASFDGAHFGDDAHFIESIFAGGVRFHWAHFLDVSFNRAQFEPASTFDHARFDQRTSFFEAVLHNVTFIDTDFFGHVSFERAELDLTHLGSASYSLGARFSEGAAPTGFEAKPSVDGMRWFPVLKSEVDDPSGS